MAGKSLLSVSGPPENFSGSVWLPPSKSYLHRALFIAALARGRSRITSCGSILSDDILATEGVLRALGVRITRSPESHGTLLVTPPKKINSSRILLDARGSGTTARFAIPFAAALSPQGTFVKITGDESLTKRPMESIFESLSQLGVSSRSEQSNGRLPVIVEGGGIRGGSCDVDGSISSQFISSLLISCTRAEKGTKVRIRDPSRLVSKPYIQATLSVLSYFGFRVKVIGSKNYQFVGFEIEPEQKVKGRIFRVPGDMSSAASLIGAALASRGRLTLLNFEAGKLPQSDSAIIPIAKKLGGKIELREGTGRLLLASSTSPYSNKKKSNILSLDLGDAPDLVPVVAGLAAAAGSLVRIRNIAHLRYKESDRLGVLSRELENIGVRTVASRSSLSILGSGDNNLRVHSRKPILLDPEKDHRMFMALTVAGLSGKFGELLIQDPDCVKKSYPNFVKDIQRLIHQKSTLKTIKIREERGGRVTRRL